MLRILTVLIVALAASPAVAFGLTFGPGQPREYSYPSEPQYQYPETKPRRKCPKGQALWQGRCRIVRPVH